MSAIIYSNTQPTVERFPTTAEYIWEMSDGVLVAVGYLDGTGGETPGWHRWKSADKGATWVGIDPTALPTRVTLGLTQAGDVIIGLNIDATGADIIKWTYAGAAFGDSKTAYTPTNAWNVHANTAVAAAYDAVKGAVHVMLVASSDGGTTDYVYLVAIAVATGLKVTEARFTVVDTSTVFRVDLTVDAASSPKLWLVYRSAATDVRFRSYTYSGTAYAIADAEETVVTPAVAPAGVQCGLAPTAGQLDIFWDESSSGPGPLKTRRRTAAATYSGIVTLVAADVWRLEGLCEYDNTNKDVILLYTSRPASIRFPRYIKRLNDTWGSPVTIISDAVNPSIASKVRATSRAHLQYTTGWYPYYNWYDYVGAAANPTATNVKPTGTSNTDSTPTISAKYDEALAGDQLGKVLIVIAPSATMLQHYSNSAIADPAVAPTALDNGAGVMAAGTYRYGYTWVTPSGETRISPIGTVTIAASRQVALSAIAVGPAGVTSRNIYRSPVGGAAGSERLLATLANNTATTYNDNTADAGLGALTPPTLNNADGAAVAAGTNPGATYSTDYAGPTLVKGTEYSLGVRFFESVDGKWSSITWTTFQWNDPPLAARPWTTADASLARTRVGVALAQPRATELFASLCTVRRRLATAATADPWTTLLSSKAITRPTEVGLTYAQMPTKGLARNLVADGAPFAVDTLDASATLVDDATAPAGRALRAYGTGYTTAKIARAEAGRSYNTAVSMKGDGTNNGEVLVEWLDAAFAVLSVMGTLVRSAATYADMSLGSLGAPASTKYVRFRCRSAVATGLAYFSAFRLEETTGAMAAWSSAKQQLLGDTGVVFDADADVASVAWPSDVDAESFAVTIGYRPTVVPHVAAPVIWSAGTMADRLNIELDTTTSRPKIWVSKASGAWADSGLAASSAVTGDTQGICAMKDATGLYVDTYVNGAALASVSNTGEKAKWHGLVPATMYIGRYAGASNHADGTIGIVRLQKAMNAARRQAFALNPYMAPQPEDQHIYAVTGSGVYEVPIHDDEIAGPGITYDYAVDTTSATPPATTAAGAAFEEGYAAIADMLWLKCPATPTLNLKLRQKYDARWPNERGRNVQLLDPVDGGAALAIYNSKPGGRSFDIDAMWPESAASLADVATAIIALNGLQATDNDVYLLDYKGHSVKVVFADPIRRRDHSEGYLEVQTRVVEAQ